MPFFETPTGKIYYEEYGHGPPLLIAPAFGATTRTYRGLLPNLTETHRVILYDLRGMGQSDDLPESPTLEWAADDLVGLMDHLGIGRATVLGPSMGAIIAQMFAVKYRERLDRLVVLTPPVTKSWHRSRINEMFADLLESHPPERLMRHMLVLALNPDFVDKRPSFLDQMAKSIQVTERERQTMLKLLGGSFVFEGVSGLETMDAPTLIIAGEIDMLTPPSQARLLHQQLPHSKLVIMSRVAHSPFLENTNATFREIRHFLACPAHQAEPTEAAAGSNTSNTGDADE